MFSFHFLSFTRYTHIFFGTFLVLGLFACGGGGSGDNVGEADSDPEDENQPYSYSLSFSGAVDDCGNAISQEIGITLLDTDGNAESFSFNHTGAEDIFTLGMSSPIIGKTLSVDTQYQDWTIVDVPSDQSLHFQLFGNRAEIECECPSYDFDYYMPTARRDALRLFAGTKNFPPDFQTNAPDIAHWRGVTICDNAIEEVFIVDDLRDLFTRVLVDDSEIIEVMSLRAMEGSGLLVPSPPSQQENLGQPLIIGFTKVTASSSDILNSSFFYSGVWAGSHEAEIPIDDKISDMTLIARANVSYMQFSNLGSNFLAEDFIPSDNVNEQHRISFPADETPFEFMGDAYQLQELAVELSGEDMQISPFPGKSFDFVALLQYEKIGTETFSHDVYIPIRNGMVDLNILGTLFPQVDVDDPVFRLSIYDYQDATSYGDALQKRLVDTYYSGRFVTSQRIETGLYFREQ